MDKKIGMLGMGKLIFPFLLANGFGLSKTNVKRTQDDKFDEKTHYDIIAIKARQEMLHDRLLLRSGCSRFNIEGTSIIALNKKNAIRKYKNLIKNYL